MRPMLATRGDRVPAGPGWSHEVKWDGMRVLADVRRAPAAAEPTLVLTSRAGNEVTPAYPELHPLAAALGRDALLDGEVVALADGRPSFAALADRMHVRSPRRAQALAASNPVTLLLFDVLRLDGEDLTGRTLTERRAVLAGLDALQDGASWQVPPAYDDGALLLEATRQQGLEGIVSKRLDSRYLPGARSPHWLKFPHRPRASYVVGGWRPETGSGSSERLGALLVGEPTADGLVYRGRVGSGLGGKAGPRVKALLEPLAAAASPFADEVPRVDATGARWVRPVLVVDVESLGTSRQGRLRQPSWCGVRDDLAPEDLLADEEDET